MTEFAKTICIVAVLALATLLAPGSPAYSNDMLFQTSPISALQQGVFDGNMTFKDLRAYGDFGLGTVQALDGEMVELDGQFYQVKSDGVAYRLNNSTKTPFAEVTFFKPDETVALSGTSNLTQLCGFLDSKLDTTNIFYAIRIDDTFDYVETRSVPIQSKPYPTLSEAVEGQKIFEFHNVKGTIVGFRCPDYINGVNVPGYHMHFLTANCSAGGHLLDFKLNNANIKVENLYEFELALPDNDEFNKANLSSNHEESLAKAESNPDK
jgi:acetolactate decarboxylase